MIPRIDRGVAARDTQMDRGAFGALHKRRRCCAFVSAASQRELCSTFRVFSPYSTTSNAPSWNGSGSLEGFDASCTPA